MAGVIDKPSDAWSTEDLKDVIRRLTAAYSEMRTSPIASLPLELAVVEFAVVIPANPSKLRAGAGIQTSKNVDPRVKPEDDKKKKEVPRMTIRCLAF